MAYTSYDQFRQYLRNLGQPEPEWLRKKEPGRNKFNAKKVRLDGYVFDSKKEAVYYTELKWQHCAGLIVDLWVHTRFPLVVGETLICEYEADFDFIDVKTGCWRVVDVKSSITAKIPTFQRNVKLMRQLFGIEVEVEIRDR